ncbi:MAG: helix-turn-helix domain-containing protein, partial [Thermoleophilia bacterium]
NEPTGETFAVGVVTTPVGGRAALGVDPASLAGRVVELTEAWTGADGVRRELLTLAEPDAMLHRLLARLLADLDLSDAGFARCEQAVALLEADPSRPIAGIAEELGVSHGHLDREFLRVVGLRPSQLARQRRVQRLLEAVHRDGDVAWAALAADLGWADQSHLIRDVKRHTGVTPSAYLAAQRAWTTPVDAAETIGFVPDPA